MNKSEQSHTKLQIHRLARQPTKSHKVEQNHTKSHKSEQSHTKSHRFVESSGNDVPIATLRESVG